MGREPLTLIEKLDQRFPGLAAQVNAWFEQGVTALAIASRLEGRYNVPVAESLVSSYRCRRWVRQREARLRRRLEALAAEEAQRKRARKAQSGTPRTTGRGEACLG